MSFLKIVTFTAAIIFCCCCSSTVSEPDSSKLADCLRKCEEVSLEEAMKKEEILCRERKLGGQESAEPISKCGLECYGEKPVEDQNGCFAKFCKEFVKDNAGMFCAAPGEGLVTKPDECDSMVATGKAKFRGAEFCYKKN